MWHRCKVIIFVIGGNAVDVCENISSIQDSYSCISFREGAGLPWDDALDNCMFLAPVGYHGRLAHIPSSAVANQAIFNNSGWIGARAFVNDSSDVANFFWYENQTEPIGNFSYLPALFNFGKLLNFRHMHVLKPVFNE